MLGKACSDILVGSVESQKLKLLPDVKKMTGRVFNWKQKFCETPAKTVVSK